MVRWVPLPHIITQKSLSLRPFALTSDWSFSRSTYILSYFMIIKIVKYTFRNEKYFRFYLVVCYFNITFAAKLTIKIQNKKETMKKEKTIDVRVYYQKLSKKEKGLFLRYLSRTYDYPASTISGKLRLSPISSLRKDEEMNIMKTIEEGLWKQ